MRHMIVLAFIGLAASACARPPAAVRNEPAAATKAASRAAVAGVDALIREWSAAGAEGRYDDLKALYADDTDFFWVEQGRVAYKDHASVIAGVDQVASMNAKMSNKVDDIAVTPLGSDAASFRAHATIGFVSPEFSFDFEGAFTGVAVRREGRWRFLQGHLSKAEPAH